MKSKSYLKPQENTSALVYKASEYRKLKQYELSNIYYQEALDKIYEALVLNYCNLASSNASIGHYEEAITWYDKAILIDSKFCVAYVNKANLLVKLKRNQEAIECYEQALDIDTLLFQAYHGMGSAYFNLEDYQKAIECYDKSLSINPGCTPSIKHKDLSVKALDLLGKSLLEENKVEDRSVVITEEKYDVLKIGEVQNFDEHNV